MAPLLLRGAPSFGQLILPVLGSGTSSPAHYLSPHSARPACSEHHLITAVRRPPSMATAAQTAYPT